MSFAYLAQCRCDPAGTLDYFTALLHIFQTMQDMNESIPMDLKNLILNESARNRFTEDDFQKAAILLGFGSFGPLRIGLDETVEEEFIISAWRGGVRRSWEDQINGSATRQNLNIALRVIAEVCGSAKMHNVWEHEVGEILTRKPQCLIQMLTTGGLLFRHSIALLAERDTVLPSRSKLPLRLREMRRLWNLGTSVRH